MTTATNNPNGVAQPDEDPGEVIVLAVRDYADEPPEFAPAIDDQVDAVREWAAADGRSFRDVLRDPDIEDGIYWAETDLRRRRTMGASILLYVTGHGRRGKSHRLVRSDALPYSLTPLIEGAMSCGADSVVVLIDSCYAGDMKSEVDELLEDLRIDLEAADRDIPAASCVVMSGRPEERLRLGEFTSYLRVALELTRDKYAVPESSAFLSPDIFTRALRHAAGEEGRGLRFSGFDGDYFTDQPCRSLPNPHHKPDEVLVDNSRAAVVMQRALFERFWLDKAAGHPDGDPGWYFRGRVSLNTAIAVFLRSPPGARGNLLAVTGEAGSGKTAVIARAVLLSDSRFRTDPDYQDIISETQGNLMPPVGSIDVAVSARGLTPSQVLAALAERIGIALPSRSGSLAHQVRSWVRATHGTLGRPVTLVIDGLDEGTAPTELITELLVPMVTTHSETGDLAAKLIVGVRGTSQSDDDVAARLRNYCPDARFLRADDPDSVRDIRDYVSSLLVVEGPYRNDTQAAREISDVVARQVHPRFIDARVVAVGLRQAFTTQDPDDPRWLATLSDATVHQLAIDVAAVAADSGHPREHIVASLRATALSFGAGLPWNDVWPTVTEAVLASPMPSADDVIRTVLASRLGGYLLTAEDLGRRVYRPNHQRLVEILTNSPEKLLIEETGMVHDNPA